MESDASSACSFPLAQGEPASGLDVLDLAVGVRARQAYARALEKFDLFMTVRSGVQCPLGERKASDVDSGVAMMIDAQMKAGIIGS
ncbi:MAG: hypothetical protein VX239_00995, partial [Candidatus Thermoplasmatota archaeon]|nr:hypothetical protein [Candidatus Thermoplasmatota archaeon]